MLAYVWLLLMVKYISEDVIELWEACVTCGLMVVLLVLAYRADKYSSRLAFQVNLAGTVFREETSANRHKDVTANERNSNVFTAVCAAGVLDAGGDDAPTPAELAAQLHGLAPPKSKAHYRHAVLENVGGMSLAVNHRAKKAKDLEGVQVDGKQQHLGMASSLTPQAQSTAGAPTDAPRDAPTGGTPPASRRFFSSNRSPASNRAPASPQPIPPAGCLQFVKDEVSVMESDGEALVKVERVGGAQGEVTVEYATKDQEALAGKDYEPVSGTLTFADGDAGPRVIAIPVIDDQEFERDEHFTVVLSEPTGGAIFDGTTDGGLTAAICTVTIVNDDVRATRFAKAMALLKVDRDELDLAEQTWKEQIRGAVTLPPGSAVGKLLAVLSMPWKLLFALVPPPQLMGGWPCFWCALLGIGFQVILISDFAIQMGCHMGINPSITAITFVALGTSLPDLFASKQAAVGDKYADNSVGNVTGSNSVNVFFGLGLPWLMSSAYWSVIAASGGDAAWRAKYPDIYARGWDGAFVVRSGDLGFSVLVFTMCAVVTISVVLLRRPFELGGSKKGALATAALFVSLWMLYVLLSSLVSVGAITPPI